MKYDFLKNFPRRMKHVGMYALLFQNSMSKTTWKQFGFITNDQQINMIFSVLLYIMEQSLKEENCTMDDIGAFIDELNVTHLRKNISYEECRGLGDFIVNTILSNEGKAMYFHGYDYEQDREVTMNVSYVANRVVYVDNEVRRTSYYLTDDGYNLLLSTLEIENNLKLTIHEMIFQMHLEKQSYDKAVDEIKNVFNLMRIQLQKIQEAIEKIRRNALDYSVKDYERIIGENLQTIGDTKEKFQGYRELVKSRVEKLEEEHINVKKLTPKEKEQLDNLQEIERYLGRTIDEHQRILNNHFDLKSVYSRELEALSQFSLIKRFSIGTEVYERILEQPDALEQLDYFLRPLFNQDLSKIYNINKAFELQRSLKKNQETDSVEEIDFDEEAWAMEQERLRQNKMKKYEDALEFLLELLVEAEGTAGNDSRSLTLKEVRDFLLDHPEKTEILIPNVEVFKEFMVELIKAAAIDIAELRREQSEFIQENSMDFHLNEVILKLVTEKPKLKAVRRIQIARTAMGERVVFENSSIDRKAICCSNVRFTAEFTNDENK